MRTLDGKVVAITGAGSGIGAALALECAGLGARLALSDITESGLIDTAHRAREAGAREVRTDLLDVSLRDEFVAWSEAVVAQFGVVNVMINNAGVSLHGNLLDLEPEDLDWIVGVNLWGVVHGTQAFLPHLIASGDGHLVNVSSLFGLVSVPGQSAYNATKFAVRGFTEAVREEMLVARHPVGVTVVHPGGIRTAIVRSGRVAAGVDLPGLARTFDEKLARMDPDRAAQIIVRGVLRNKPRVLVGIDAHLLHQFARLSGARYQDVVAAVTRHHPGW